MPGAASSACGPGCAYSYSLSYARIGQAMMSGYRVTHSSAAGRFAEGEPGPEGIHQVRLLVRTLVEYP